MTPKLEISQIDFEADGCYGTCPIFAMTISNDGMAKYDAKMFNERQGEFKTTIKKPQLVRLLNLIAKSDFFSLNSEYSVDYTDQPTYKLTIKLTNGKIKTIEDYGPNGPEKLKLVYKKIFSLRQSQDWK